MLISLTLVLILQCIHISNHQVVHLKYIQFKTKEILHLYFLRLNNISLYVYTTFALSISGFRHLCCFFITYLAAVINVAMMGVQVSLQDPDFNFFGSISRLGLLDLEDIMLTEISQTQKDKCCMISLTCAI